MPDYSYVVRRIRNNAVLGELALYDVEYGWAMNGYGAMSAKCAMAPARNPVGLEPLDLTQPQRFVLCIERDGVLVWAGPIWSRTCDFDKGEITIGGNEWGSVFDRVYVTADFDYFNVATKDVIDSLTAFISTLIPMPAPFRVGSGGGLDHMIEGLFTDASHPSILACINQLAADPLDGFEYRWYSEYPPINPFNELNNYMIVGSPLGVLRTTPLDYMAKGRGGSISSYTREERDTPTVVRGYTFDGFRIETNIHGFGDPTGEQPFPVQEPINFPEITDDQVIALTDARGDLYNYDTSGNSGFFRPTSTHKIGIASPSSPLDYGDPGDRQRLIIQDSETKTPERRTARILDKKVTYSADGAETLTMTLGAF